jgi:hypothetical protein
MKKVLTIGSVLLLNASLALGGYLFHSYRNLSETDKCVINLKYEMGMPFASKALEPNLQSLCKAIILVNKSSK